MSDITTTSLDEILKAHEDGTVQKPRADIPEFDMPDGFWDDAVIMDGRDAVKSMISLRIDPDILAFFKSQGKGHLTRMHSVLRSYVDAQKGKN